MPQHEDEAHASGHQGVPALAVRSDTAAQTAGTNGDYCCLICDSSGKLHVTDASSSTVADLAQTEDSAHANNDIGVMVLSVRSDTASAKGGADGDYQPVLTDANGRLHVLDQNSAAALTALQTIDNIVLLEDAAHTNAAAGVMMLSVRQDTAAALAGTDADYQPLITDSSGRLHVLPPVDTSTMSVKTIDYAHKEVHSGDAFTATARTVYQALDIATPLTMLINTADSARLCHMEFSASAAAAGYLAVHESPTNATGGTPVTAYNRYRGSATNATCVIYSGVTGDDITGTELSNTTFGGGQGVGKYGGEMRATAEWKLAGNTQYTVILGTDADNNTGTIVLDWYEHTDT